jgi:hypothetical protein
VKFRGLLKKLPRFIPRAKGIDHAGSSLGSFPRISSGCGDDTKVVVPKIKSPPSCVAGWDSLPALVHTSRGRVSYDVTVHAMIVVNTRVFVRAPRRKLVKLFRKRKSKFFWYDFTVLGCRYRGFNPRNEISQSAANSQRETGFGH